MRSFLAAIQFLTIIPVRPRALSQKDYAFALAYFPLTGAVIGFCLVFTGAIVTQLGYSRLSSDILLVVVLVFITGGMHLDGIADTFDALASRKSRAVMLDVMRDPHTGAGGVTAVVCVLMLKAAFLLRVPAEAEAVCIVLACIVSRWVPVALMAAFPYARGEGKAAAFVNGMNRRIVVISTLAAALCVFVLCGISGFVVIISVTGFIVLFGEYMRRVFGGITGDILGAAVELTELFVLFISPLAVQAAFT